jgi:ubiquinone/menaquinone biosynthesis C-methylase UbiE
MKTEWDYTELADAYIKRPDYAVGAIDEMLRLAGLHNGGKICDVGAGVGHLTKLLARHPRSEVVAVEPNDAMRKNGMRELKALSNVVWLEGCGEATGCPSGSFDLVTFGSSFNVTDPHAALKESARILKKRGWFACMWNHRDLTDPLQERIESIIKDHVPSYSYGSRREDQSDVIAASELFGPVRKIEGSVTHVQKIAECIEAWRSHATLQRQAGPKFSSVVRGIETFLSELKGETIAVPFVTRVWCAQAI